MFRRFLGPGAVLTAVAFGCGNGGSGPGGATSTSTATSSSTSGIGTGSATDSGGGSPTATGTHGGSDPSTTGTGGSSGVTATTGIRFDTAVPGAATPEDAECEKVDLLFVIDNSASMETKQAALVASFPGFVASMRAELQGVDSYHVGVTTTDVYGPWSIVTCPDTGPEICQRRGTLVTTTVDGGRYASNEVCTPYVEGGRYMTDQDDLATKFACAATVGTKGCVEERPIASMLGAVSADFNGPGGCNEGFLRSDALLVVVIITDESDSSDGTPPEWFTELVAIKGGREKNIAVLSILVSLANVTGCSGSGLPERLKMFTNMFTHGFIGDVCAPSYDAFFTAAVSVVGEACGDFVPPEG